MPIRAYLAVAPWLFMISIDQLMYKDMTQAWYHLSNQL